MTGLSRAVAADYAWVESSDHDWLFEAYCLTLVRGLTPQEFMERLGARILVDALPLGARFCELSNKYWEAPHVGAVQFIGATTVTGDGGDWTLAFQENGYLGVTPSAMGKVSVGTRLVSHFRNVNAFDQFYWIEDGEVRVNFEPLFPYNREGLTPDALLEDMREIGFDLEDDHEETSPTSAAFALAERMTGVRVTLDMLRNAVYLCGEAPLK
jgi:hypothetical protein